MNNLTAGLDPSSKQLGIAVIDNKGELLIYQDVIIPDPKLDIYERIKAITFSFNHLVCLFEDVKLVVIERPASKLNFKTLHALSVLDGIILCLLWLNYPNIEIKWVAATTVKKRAAGSGRASKEEVMAAINKRLGIVETNNNITDACAIALCGVDDGS